MASHWLKRSFSLEVMAAILVDQTKKVENKLSAVRIIEDNDFLRVNSWACSCFNHMLTSSTQLQNRSFHVIERTRTSSKCQKMKNACAKRAKILFFIVKYANCGVFVAVVAVVA